MLIRLFCLQEWVYNGQTYAGTCANPEGSKTGAWCVVDKTTCPEPLLEPASQGWDHCQVSTRAGCRCAPVWQSHASEGNANTMQFGTCLPARPGDPASGWCMIEEGSCPTEDISSRAGLSWDWCGPETVPMTEGIVTVTAIILASVCKTTNCMPLACPFLFYHEYVPLVSEDSQSSDIL